MGLLLFSLTQVEIVKLLKVFLPRFEQCHLDKIYEKSKSTFNLN